MSVDDRPLLDNDHLMGDSEPLYAQRPLDIQPPNSADDVKHTEDANTTKGGSFSSAMAHTGRRIRNQIGDQLKGVDAANYVLKTGTDFVDDSCLSLCKSFNDCMYGSVSALKKANTLLAAILIVMFLLGIGNTWLYDFQFFDYRTREYVYTQGCDSFPVVSGVEKFFGTGNLTFAALPPNSTQVVQRFVADGGRLPLCPVPPNATVIPTNCAWVDQEGREIGPLTPETNGRERLVGTHMLISLIFFVAFRNDMRDERISRVRYALDFVFSGLVSYSFRHLGYVSTGSVCSLITSVHYSGFYMSVLIPTVILVLAAYPITLLLFSQKIKSDSRVELRVLQNHPWLARYVFNIALSLILLYFLLLPPVVLGAENVGRALNSRLQEVLAIGFTSALRQWQLAKADDTVSIYLMAAAVQNLTIVLDVLIIVFGVASNALDKLFKRNRPSSVKQPRKSFKDEVMQFYTALEVIHFLFRSAIDALFLAWLEGAKRLKRLFSFVNILGVSALAILFLISIGTAFSHTLQSFSVGSKEYFTFTDGCDANPARYPSVASFYSLQDYSNSTCINGTAVPVTHPNVTISTNSSAGFLSVDPFLSCLEPASSALQNKILAQQVFAFLGWAFLRWAAIVQSIAKAPSLTKYFILLVASNVLVYPFKHLGIVQDGDGCSWVWAPHYSALYRELVLSFLILICVWVAINWKGGKKMKTNEGHKYVTWVCCEKSELGLFLYRIILPSVFIYSIVFPTFYLGLDTAAHVPPAFPTAQAYLEVFLITSPLDYPGATHGAFFPTAVVQGCVLAMDILFLVLQGGITSTELHLKKMDEKERAELLL